MCIRGLEKYGRAKRNNLAENGAQPDFLEMNEEGSEAAFQWAATQLLLL